MRGFAEEVNITIAVRRVSAVESSLPLVRISSSADRGLVASQDWAGSSRQPSGFSRAVSICCDFEG